MKKLSVMCAIALFVGLMVSPVFAMEYCKDYLEEGNPGGAVGVCAGLPALSCTSNADCPDPFGPCDISLKSFEEEIAMAISDTVFVDVWINDLRPDVNGQPDTMISGGFKATWTSNLEVVSILPYDSAVGGPWDSDMTNVDPSGGPNEVLVILGQLGCASQDADGDIILAKLEIHKSGPGNGTLTITTVPGFATFASCIDFQSMDDQIPTNVFTIIGGCETNSDCDDEIDCTVDICNTETGECDNTPNDALCDDSVSCTVDTCDNITVRGCVNDPDDALCNDDNVCTDDSCDPVNDCQHDPNTLPCQDDGIYCNGVEICGGGTCNHSGDPCLPNACVEDGDYCESGGPCDPPCNDGIACTEDICNTATGECSYLPNDALCDDGVACTEDSCNTTSGCVNDPDDALCNDDNVCTDDSCDPVNDCQHDPNTLPCQDDGIYCNGEEICGGGTCNHTGDPCLPDACVEDGDYCDSGGCDPPCVDDGNVCNGTETCIDGVCVSVNPLNCDDGDVCNGTETCDPSDGCQPGTPLNCDDGDECTRDWCDNGCKHEDICGECDVTLSVGDADAAPGDKMVEVEVSLTNKKDKVRGIQVDICDGVDDLKTNTGITPPPPPEDCLVCTGCEAIGRAAMSTISGGTPTPPSDGFKCSTNELENGCCRVILVATEEYQLIGMGEGPIFTLNYDTAKDCPGGCLPLMPKNVKVADPLDIPLEVCDANSGEVCFSLCGDVFPGGEGCGNGEVDIFDVLESIDITLENVIPSACQLAKADIPNGSPPDCSPVNGEIDIFDVIVIIDVILQRDNCCQLPLVD